MRTARPAAWRACALVVMAGAGLIEPGLHAAEPARPRGSLDPDQARTALHLDPGLRAELVAAEPEVQSSVAIAFDEDGKLWVVEMLDYPRGPAPGGRPEGRIKVLEDRDGDGRFERSTVFADGLLFANGLLPWKGGVIVTAAPHILYLRDDDGDGKADRREVLYEGFAAENPQLRVSHPVLGVDGWVYVANGLRGGKVRRAGRPGAEAIDLSGRDFRFDPVRDRAEPIAGMGQFGNTFDDWGHRFVCTNRNHLVPIVLEDRYARRNPFLTPPGPLADNQEAGGAAPIFPLSRNRTTAGRHAGSFSASCGVTVYRETLLDPAYRGSAFTCDPTGNLVHQEILTPDGASFAHRPAREGVEFLASPDDWFRPVSLAHGPDGALYVVDMDRAVIEHPDFMPPELKGRADVLLGKDRGRIWRIVPEGHREPASRPRLGRATTPELVELLGHPGAWWRTTAQRLLLGRGDPAAIESLRAVVGSADRPLARLHAAWLLEGAGALEDGLVLALLVHPHPRLREHGVLLAERRLSNSSALRDRVIALAADPDPRVRYQVALSLGAWDDARILAPLAAISVAGAEDRWTRLGVESAVPARAGALLTTLLQPPHALAARPEPGRLALLRELAALVGSRRDPGEVAAVLKAIGAIAGPEADRWRLAALVGLADGAGRRGASLGAILAGLPDSAAAVGLLAGAVAVAEDPKKDADARLDAIRLLAHVSREVAEPPLARLLTADPAQEIRIAAARALAAHPGPEAAARLLAPWPSCTPAVRREVALAILARPERAAALLDEIQAGRIHPGDLDPAQARLLLEAGPPESRARARTLLRASLPEGRKAVLDRYRAALDREGNAGRGKAVFQKTCATCHQVAGVGVAVGPDVSDPYNKTKAMLLGDILDPNAAIDGNFVNYTLATRDGRTLTGLIAAETASALTLRRAEGQQDVILRGDIEALRSTGVSLMPEGLEKDINVEQMADLLAFLKGWRDLDDSVAPPAGDASGVRPTTRPGD